MRARDNRHRADELAAVVRWLRGQADAMGEAGVKLREFPALARQSAAFELRAQALREAAWAIEKGEHHDRT